MNISVGTSQVTLNVKTDYPDVGVTGQTLVIQNLGVGDLYFDFKTGVTLARGVKVAALGAYEVVGYQGQPVYLIASAASTDVRYTVSG